MSDSRKTEKRQPIVWRWYRLSLLLFCQLIVFGDWCQVGFLQMVRVIYGEGRGRICNVNMLVIIVQINIQFFLEFFYDKIYKQIESGSYPIASRFCGSRLDSIIDICMLFVLSFLLFNSIHMYILDKMSIAKGIRVVKVVAA